MAFQEEYNLVGAIDRDGKRTGRLGYMSALSGVAPAFFPGTTSPRRFTCSLMLWTCNLRINAPIRCPAGQRQRGHRAPLMQHPDILLPTSPRHRWTPRPSVEIMELMAELAGKRNIPSWSTSTTWSLLNAIATA